MLAGAGSERARRRVPALASRVLTWELVPRLRPGEVAAAMTAFHLLWEDVSEVDVAWVDEHVGHGNFRDPGGGTGRRAAAVHRHAARRGSRTPSGATG
ncbi:hypothetical protein ACWDA8_17210, partial [Streptomyces sp. NPDC001130]